jgi:predicted NodU family carbamoyl transferase
MDHAYWGPSFGREDIARLLTAARSRIAEAACGCEEIAQRTQLCRRAAAAITDGKVVGWFQGRMEWGLRALGDLSGLRPPSVSPPRRHPHLIIVAVCTPGSIPRVAGGSIPDVA